MGSPLSRGMLFSVTGFVLAVGLTLSGCGSGDETQGTVSISQAKKKAAESGLSGPDSPPVVKGSKKAAATPGRANPIGQ